MELGDAQVAGLPERLEPGDGPIDEVDLRGQTDALEQKLIRRALAEHGTQTKTAKALGVSRFGLQRMLKRLGIAPG